MKMKTHFSLILFTVNIFLIFSCSTEPEISSSADDFYHIEIDEAYIPVWVRGNTASNTILLYIQGGPGIPTIDFATVDYPKWKNSLEQDVAIAYYDQRGVGNKQGKFDTSRLTIEQYSKDLKQIILFLKYQYPEAKIFAMGHSFGGWLSYHYLTAYEEHGLDGLISIAGPVTHDGDNVFNQRWEFRREFLIRAAERFIEMDIQRDLFVEAKAWAENTVIDEPSEIQQWNEYVSWGFNGADGEVGLKDYLTAIFRSSINAFPNLDYEIDEFVADKLSEDEQKYNLIPFINSINVPVLLLAGEFDDISPVEEMEFIFDRLPNPQSEFHVVNNAGHDLFLDQPEAFASVINAFINN